LKKAGLHKNSRKMRKQACAKSTTPIQAPSLAQWTLTAPGKITIFGEAGRMTINSDRLDSDYKPISCASYDQYEIAIMHGSKMHLTWQASNVIYDQVVTPLNLRTGHGEEYLILRLASGETAEIRLDHILRTRTL
jgi:Rho-binding antiterminator